MWNKSRCKDKYIGAVPQPNSFQFDRRTVHYSRNLHKIKLCEWWQNKFASLKATLVQNTDPVGQHRPTGLKCKIPNVAQDILLELHLTNIKSLGGTFLSDTFKSSYNRMNGKEMRSICIHISKVQCTFLKKLHRSKQNQDDSFLVAALLHLLCSKNLSPIYFISQVFLFWPE